MRFPDGFEGLRDRWVVGVERGKEVQIVLQQIEAGHVGRGQFALVDTGRFGSVAPREGNRAPRNSSTEGGQHYRVPRRDATGI